MTVSAQTPINRSIGNGVTTVFPYGFKILNEADVLVTVDGVVKTVNVDYTVSGVGVEAGGNVTFTVAPANLTSVVRRRSMALVRTIDYQDQGELPAATLDEDLDAAILMIQQVDEQIDRALTLPAGVTGVSAELPEPAASMFLGWNSAANAIENFSGVASVPVSLAMVPVVSASTLAGARAAIGLGAGADIASAATLDLTGRTGNILRVTGVVATSAITLENGGKVELIAPAGWVLTYHATNNPVQGGRTYTCEAGDTVVYERDGAGVLHNWIIRACGNTVSEVGEVVQLLGTAAIPGTVKLNGTELNRADYPNLYAYAAASGNMEASDAAWVANRTANGGVNGKFSPGNGTTTFRAPDVRGAFARLWSDGSTVDSGRAVGSFQAGTDHIHMIMTNTPSLVSTTASATANVESWGTSVSRAYQTTGWGGDGTTVPQNYKSRPSNLPFLAAMKY